MTQENQEAELREEIERLYWMFGSREVTRVAALMDQELNERFICLDCKTSTLGTGDYYMVHDSIWDSVVPSGEGMLCFKCLEGRIGRRLTWDDFTDAPVNEYHVKDERFRP